jgi:hypothetical protein
MTHSRCFRYRLLITGVLWATYLFFYMRGAGPVPARTLDNAAAAWGCQIRSLITNAVFSAD